MKPIPSDHIIRIKQLDGTRIYESDLINHQKEILRVEYVSNKDGDIREGRLSGKECMEMIRWVIPPYISVSKLVTDDSTSEAKDSKNRWPLTLFASIMGNEIMYGFNSPKAFEGKKNFLEHILPLDWDILYHIVLLTLNVNDRKVLFAIIEDIETVFKIIAAKGGSTLEYKVRQQLEPPKPQQITFVPFEEGRGYYI